RAEEPLAEADEGEDQEELQGVGREVDGLDDRLIQAQGDGRGEAEDGRRADDRVDGDRQANGHGQRDLLGREALGQLLMDRVADLPLEEAHRVRAASSRFDESPETGGRTPALRSRICASPMWRSAKPPSQ